jgi:hypothetical protein
MSAQPDRIEMAGGNLYLSQELCATWFPGVLAVALLRRDGQILIVPLAAQSAGGLLLKQRNARGDRVIHAQEFCRQHGVSEEFAPRACAVHWSAESAALVVQALPE